MDGNEIEAAMENICEQPAELLEEEKPATIPSMVKKASGKSSKWL